MSQLYLPWGAGERYTNRLQVRNQFASTLELHKQSSYEYQEPIQRQRSPSLPPIRHSEPDRRDERRPKEVLNRNIPSAKRFAFYDEDGEGDTSGYGSETVNHIRGGLHDVTNHNPVMAWQQDDKDNRSMGPAGADVWSARSPRSATDEGRPRWGDRGVATGRLWEPTNPNARLPQMPNQKKGTPSWVERGLNMIDNTADVLVIDQRSSTNSGFECDGSSCNGSDEGNRTFLRGQNVPLEPEVKAQRENQRLKALELQSAILSQLEDREKRRIEERERKLREERLEELRIQRQQEEDRIRLEEEKRRNEEKQLQEQRKLETLKKALEEAEKKAKLEKEKRFISLKQNMNSNIVTNDIKTKVEENVSTESPIYSEAVSPTKSNRTYDVHSAKSQKKETNSQQTTEFNSPRSAGPGNLNLYIHNGPPLALADNQFNIVPIGINGNGELVSAQPNGIQLAVLVPQNLSNSLYSVSLNSLNNVNELSETGKVLTPRKYRIAKTKDVSTQTDPVICRSSNDKILETEDVERNNDKEYSNIDENAPQDSNHNTLKKDRRFRSEERYKKDIENRPKWGVNRPAAQYKKQSEKDPFYSQKRKMRQKYRAQARQYMSQSSDDSRSPSPPTRSEKTDSNQKTRNSLSQSYWRSKRSSQDLSRNNNTDSNNAAPEFVHLSQITANETENKKSPKMSPSKRMTLSQKFINDKYGNRRLWVDDVNERNSKSNIFDVENRKKLIDQLNTAKRDYYERNEDHDNLVIKTKY
ncbi:myb-like protein X isoform X2 [Pectinophora gossypiella]|nr:myb-like protein X isoform X2 [Pectinophora gossypiella]